MDSLIFSVNAISPIIIMVAIGYFLKRIGWITPSFIKMGNNLVFNVFLRAMLFLNVYKIESFGGIHLDYIVYCLVAEVVIFLLAIPVVITVTRKKARRGVLLQATFRSNYALIGIPLAQSLFGEQGVMVASLLSAVLIPLFNILAVISLSAFRDQEGKKTSVTNILKDIIRNPLIQSIFLGLVALGARALFVKYSIDFRLKDIAPLFTVLTNLSNMATPLALLVLGAQFEFSAVSKMRKEIVIGTLLRTIIVPFLALGVAYLFFTPPFSGAHFAAMVAAFATPIAVSSVPMTQEMGGDTELAGQLVVWTTLTSAFSVFLIAFLLRYLGVF